MNYFTLFDLPIDFSINTSLLNQRFRALASQGNADQSQLNSAFSTLNEPAKRAAYVLQLQGQDANLDASISDVQFLYTALELREQLDDNPHSESLLHQLAEEAEEWQTSLIREFAIDVDALDWSEARDTCRKLLFIERLQHDIAEANSRLLDDPDVADDWESY